MHDDDWIDDGDQDEGWHPNWRALVGALLVVMALSVVGLAFLGTNVSQILSTVGASVGGPIGAVPADPGAEPDSGEGSNPDTGNEQPGPNGAAPNDIAAFQDAARPDLLIIRTGSMTIEVTDLDAALAAAASAMTSIGGYESGSERGGRDEHANATVVYRFPAADWERALASVRGIGDEVLDEQSQTSDVSAQVVDIEARIRNLRVTEAAFQSIMDRATVIKDVLNVQGELTRVRSEIEQLTAKATELRAQAAMSTLRVAFVLPETPAVAKQEGRFDPGHETEAATARLVGILQALATAGIWFGIVWLPVLLPLAIVGGIAFLVSRRLRAKVAVS
jgi:hypothetical protein